MWWSLAKAITTVNVIKWLFPFKLVCLNLNLPTDPWNQSSDLKPLWEKHVGVSREKQWCAPVTYHWTGEVILSEPQVHGSVQAVGSGLRGKELGPHLCGKEGRCVICSFPSSSVCQIHHETQQTKNTFQASLYWLHCSLSSLFSYLTCETYMTIL